VITSHSGVLFQDVWRPVTLPPDLPPLLLVVVDTEEEFDWAKPFSRQEVSVRSMAAQHRMHRIFDKFGIKPTYVIDYPVISQEEGVAPLRELLEAGSCIVGTHLQPWVNPPFLEQVSDRNSFPGNLEPDLERRKLEMLTRKIEDVLGISPTIYKAGRYGLGPHTFRTLAETGYTIDLSAVPGADLRWKFGPDFRRIRPIPYWVGDAKILELPMTRGYTGLLAALGPQLDGLLNIPLARWLHLGGIFARFRLLEGIILSPEGENHRQHLALLRELLKRGVRIFSLTYHSPSLVPGNTPYVRSDADLRRFLETVEQFCAAFIDEFAGVPTDPLSIRKMLLDAEAREASAAPPAGEGASPAARSAAASPPRAR